jgi:hypothetical protein
MRAILTETFADSLIAAPPEIQRLFGKQLAHLLRDLRHPSLRAKKYDETRWQARVDHGWRLYFRIEGDCYILLDMVAHPK